MRAAPGRRDLLYSGSFQRAFEVNLVTWHEKGNRLGLCCQESHVLTQASQGRMAPVAQVMLIGNHVLGQCSGTAGTEDAVRAGPQGEHGGFGP